MYYKIKCTSVIKADYFSATWSFRNHENMLIWCTKPKSKVLKVDKDNRIKQMRLNIFFVIYSFRKMIQYCISLSGKSMWTSWISRSFKGEIRVHLCRGVFSAMTVKSQWPVLFKEQGSIKVWSCLWKWIMAQRRLMRTSEKELMLLIRLEMFTKPSLKSLASTNPPSDRLCTNWGNSRPLWPSREVADQRRSFQRTCNSLRGCKCSQGNF